ncbi:MAG: UDP-N-acetylglucosamine 4,6-dehydratase (inverting) [Proteobacteria bacterium]|nr:UDP-N-acetylglucosamine 4,6-dehydratase (inverting) [Pseudomonadota bacterium]
MQKTSHSHAHGLIDGKSILITGGTGSFGRRFVERVLAGSRPRRVIVFSRDELKQQEMRQSVRGGDSEPMRYFIGDVRDRDRLQRAFHDVDIVVHAAALKQVPACEYNPIEAVLTNVMGARNVVDAAIDQGVERVIALSTDKAVNPVNIYGATKLCMEKLVVQANVYSGHGQKPSFACSRYGNVIGSRGSVVPIFQAQRDRGRITVTDRRMTRFWLTLDEGVDFVLHCLERMQGGEIFVPRIPSMRVMDLVSAMAPDCRVEFVGIRPGEKLHESLLSEDEARHAVAFEDMYVILPEGELAPKSRAKGGDPLPEGFRYTSDNNRDWLSLQDLMSMLEQVTSA